MKTILDLKQLEPCEDGYKFAKSKNSLIEAWNTCESGDWMLWFAKKLGCPIRELTLAKGLCAKTVIHLMCDSRSRKAVEVAIDFGNGVASREELDTASDAANAAAAYAAAYAAADYAAAANAANAAAYAAADAAYTAAYAAACDASAAAADAAKKENQRKTANICREILTDFIKSKL